MDLAIPIEKIRGIGEAAQKKLLKLGIKTIKDLLFHFPNRYEDFSNFKSITDIAPGSQATIRGRILDIKNIRTWKKRMNITEAIVEDDSGAIKAVWFNQPYLEKTLRQDACVNLSGKAVIAKNGMYLSNPAYEVISYDPKSTYIKEALHTGRLVPVYPETYGLTSRFLRSIIKKILRFSNQMADALPQEIKKAHNLPSMHWAINQIHFPNSLENAGLAKRRFAFEELFTLQLFMQRKRAALAKQKAPPIRFDERLAQQFVKSLPYELTEDQKKAAWQIIKDMEKNEPMNRLLEGDVGSGKTIVAVMAAFLTAKNGMQTALMAPTEILSRQHFEKIEPLLEKFSVKTGLLTSSEAKIADENCTKKQLVQKIKSGEVPIIIGTHALIQKNVGFKNLALVVIDEQHRFGVEQRAALQNQEVRSKKQEKDQDAMIHDSGFAIPHLLSMSATPIPRTLGLTIWGDLDLSILKQMPKGRKPILTKVVPPKARQNAYEFIRKEIKAGRQAFVICPLIDESEKLEVKSAIQEYEKLHKHIFPDLKIGLLHGKLKPKEKETVMAAFVKNDLNVLVSTSVVEVGIDVPNAAVMMIEGAERFGLAQLYQFRGRVGRSEYQSHCFLFTDSPSSKTAKRLKAITAAQSGFELAEKDLEIRGPGEFTGVRQSGLPDLAMSSLTDVELIEKTRASAKMFLAQDPVLKNYPTLLQKLLEFERKVHLE